MRRLTGLEIVNKDALVAGHNMFVHAFHFKTHTEVNPAYSLSPSTKLDALEWGADYDLSVPQLAQAMCSKSTWGSSVFVNLLMLEGHANAGTSMRGPLYDVYVVW